MYIILVKKTIISHIHIAKTICGCYFSSAENPDFDQKPLSLRYV